MMGEDDEAEDVLNQAVELRRTLLGEEHPHYAASLHVLANVYARTERADEAIELMSRAAAIDDRMIGEVFGMGSDNQRLAYLRRTGSVSRRPSSAETAWWRRCSAR